MLNFVKILIAKKSFKFLLFNKLELEWSIINNNLRLDLKNNLIKTKKAV